MRGVIELWAAIIAFIVGVHALAYLAAWLLLRLLG